MDLAPEFRYSSYVHAARALLHSGFATDEARANARVAQRVSSFAFEPAGTGCLRLRYDVVRATLDDVGDCSEETLRCRGTYRDDPAGGRLDDIRCDLLGDTRPATFVPRHAEHRARAFAHRWLWAWENAGDGSVFAELLCTSDLDVRFHTGPPVTSQRGFDEAVRRLDAGAPSARHALEALAVRFAGPRYLVSADVGWRVESSNGTPLRARTRYDWELLDGAERYVRLQRMRVTLLEPLRAELAEEAPGPAVPNAPSDDAEAGGP